MAALAQKVHYTDVLGMVARVQTQLRKVSDFAHQVFLDELI